MANGVSRRGVLRGAGTIGAGGLIGVGPASANGRKPLDRYIVGVEPGNAQVARRHAEDVYRVLDFGDIGEAVSGWFPESALDPLRNNPNVRYIEPEGEMRAIAQTLPWGIDRVDANVAHDDGETGSGADIAIIDTGIDHDHPDLQANLGEGTAFISCGSRHSGQPCFGGDCQKEWSDDHDHGTHCAGIAAALDNGEGVVGVAPDATLHAVKVLDCNGSGTYSDVAAGIEWTADQGYDVGSLSLGGDRSATVQDACQYAYDRGVLLVAAAGNDGECTDCVGYPGAYETVMAISATTEDDSLASFSSTGPEIELAAPGEGIYSTVIDGYDTFSGTSMACPHVSGAGAQLMANGYANTEARDRLNATAEDIGLGENEQGNGLLDVAAALGLDSGDGDGETGNAAPTVDSLSAAEVETDNEDAEFDADWQVSDDDGNLDSVELMLFDDTDGEEEDTTTVSVSGDSASGTTRLVAAGDDGSGNDYTIEAVVTDSDGATDSASTSVSETEETSDGDGDSPPSIDNHDLSNANTRNPHAEIRVDWTVFDEDADLAHVVSELYDESGGFIDDDQTSVSGDSADGLHGWDVKHGQGGTYEVQTTVTDETGNQTTTSDTIDT